MLPAILNTSIITAFGSFKYEPLTLVEAQAVIQNGFTSYVGHDSTCDILSELLETPIAMNRAQFAQAEGQQALVFKLNGRPPEGQILSRAQLEEIGFSFGLLTRTA